MSTQQYAVGSQVHAFYKCCYRQANVVAFVTAPYPHYVLSINRGIQIPHYFAVIEQDIIPSNTIPSKKSTIEEYNGYFNQYRVSGVSPTANVRFISPNDPTGTIQSKNIHDATLEELAWALDSNIFRLPPEQDDLYKAIWVRWQAYPRFIINWNRRFTRCHR